MQEINSQAEEEESVLKTSALTELENNQQAANRILAERELVETNLETGANILGDVRPKFVNTVRVLEIALGVAGLATDVLANELKRKLSDIPNS